MPLESSRKALQSVRRNLFFILVAVTTLAFLGMIGPFLITVLWAIVLTMTFYGLFRWVRRRVGTERRALAAAITSLLIFFFVIIPFVFLSFALVNQGLGLYDSIQTGEMDPTMVVDYVEKLMPGIYDMLGDNGQFLATQVLSVGTNLVNVFVQFTLMLYLLYFFLKDGKLVLDRIINTIPMGKCGSGNSLCGSLR